jgi:hypothetical protein
MFKEKEQKFKHGEKKKRRGQVKHSFDRLIKLAGHTGLKME